jgi:adenylyl cyclase-associated protein
MPFAHNGGDFKTNLEAILKEGSGSAPAPAEEKKEEKKEPKKEEKKPAAKKPAEKKKLPPSKVKRGKMWDISGYEKETIEFKEDEVEKGNFFMITSCTDTPIIIHGIFNNMSVTSCKNCAVVIDSVIASVEIIKGDNVKLQVNEKAPQVIIDRSNKTGLYLNDNSKDLKINTTCSSTTFVHFPTKEVDSNGNDEASVPIPETYVSVIKDDQIITEPLDLAD